MRNKEIREINGRENAVMKERRCSKGEEDEEKIKKCEE